ncbi:KfrB domain-containing protein [Eikenella halliae]|uniref:Fic family protein n=1 Tax=Eikenella halliae TaxID=1795832 RepID=UPI00370D982A
MSLSKEEQIEFDSIASDNLQRAIEQLRRTQDFSFRGLKQLHDSAFFPSQDLPEKIRAEMNNFYQIRPARDDWGGKLRFNITPYPYETYYSPLESADYQRAERAIELAKYASTKDLPFDEKVERLAQVYAEVDYLHAFWDGNSRVNRMFVRELAASSGVELDFSKVSEKDMYIARDKSLAELNLSRRPEQLKNLTHMNPNPYVSLQGSLEELNQYYPKIDLSSVFRRIAAEQTIRHELDYSQMRAVVNSTGVVLQQKTGDAWQDVERMPAEGMKAGVYPLGAAKPAAADQSYEGEVVYKDNASIFQQTKQGLVRHQNTEQLAGQVRIGQRYAIGNGQAKAASLTASRSMKQTHGRRL